MHATRTIHLPSNIAPDCSANPATVLLSELEDGRWLVHPADYDVAQVTEEDVLRDSALRFLRADEASRIDDDLDFAMLTPPTRPGPCKAATSPEVDPVERRIEREAEAAPHVAEHYRMGDEVVARFNTVTRGSI